MEFAEFIKSPKIDKVILHSPFHKEVEGTLCITGHHIILSSRKNEENEELWLLHRMVDCVERKMGQTGGILILKCKDFRCIHLEISGLEEATNVANSIECLSSLANVKYYYPFFHRAMFNILEDGWTAFLPETEFSKISMNTEDWRITHVNKNYSICPTYPEILVVPKKIDDETLISVANFHYLSRFPVLSYFHKESKASVLRSSQPMIGPNNRRCKEDKALMSAALVAGKRGYIIDTRAQNFAQLARTKGGGFESEIQYPLWRRIHKPIDRHSTFLNSLSRLIEACNDTNSTVDKWLSRLESSGWLNHVKDILNCACLVAQSIDQEGFSVLVHGAEGTDATLQVCSLAQVILDPDCRTVRGLEALIEREWLQAGHPFSTRCLHGAYAPNNIRTKDQSPTFLMFLDCVYQIHQQFPCSFEFNEQFLIMLFEHSYASQFGTFLGDCDKERKDLKLSEKTVSLWSHVNQPEIITSYLNPMYEPNNKVIWPTVAPQSLTLWPSMYLRWVCDLNPQIEAWKIIAEIKEKDKELKSKALKLSGQLEREAIRAGVMSPPIPDDVLSNTD